MMEISSGVVRVTKGSNEEKEFDTLYESIRNLSDEFLIQYHNEIIKSSIRTPIQSIMLTVIAYARGQVVKEYF